MSSNSLDVIQQSQFIRAGAGAGKTTRLISTFLDFVREFRKKHNAFPRVVLTTFTRKATQEVKERLLVSAIDESDIFEYINKRSSVHISTIHGLLSLFLSQYADTIHFSSEIKVIDGPQYEKLLKRQISEIFKKHPEFISLLESYSFSELVELAKKSLDLKAQYSHFTHVDQAELKEISAAARKRIVKAIELVLSQGADANDSWKNYFNSLSALKKAAEINDLKSFRAILDEMPPKPRWSAAKPNLDPALHDTILLLKDDYFENLWDSDEFIESHQILNSQYLNFINRLYELNSDHKRKTGEMTISDLESLTVQIIDSAPEAVAEFSDAWDYFMIDEYQDTSPIQVKILNAFVKNKPCFIVGDPQQSIYLFRGARSEVFANKQLEMQQKNHKIDFLQTNYRSEPRLMSFINDFFREYSGQFQSMNLKENAKFQFSEFHDVYYVRGEGQSRTAVEQIQRLISLGAKPGEICVLSRNNRNLEEIAVCAAEYGVDVQLQAAAGFEEKREILDLIAFNRFLVNPHDNENLVTLLRTPWLYLSDQEIISIRESENSTAQSLWSQIQQNSHPISVRLQNYIHLFDAAGVLQTNKQFISDVNFLQISRLYDRSGKREANIIKFLSALSKSEEQAGFSLGLFLDEKFQSISIDAGSSNSEAQPVLQPNSVSLMTVHASKGLQFDHVIVVGFSDLITSTVTQKLMFDSDLQKFSLSPYVEEELKTVPSQWSYRLRDEIKKREDEENERVLYVAMTRAIRSLSLVSDSSKKSNKNTWYAKIKWPELGAIQKEKYSILSLEFENKLTKNRLSISDLKIAKKPFAGKDSSTDDASSVTELLSVTASVNDRPQFDRQLENLKKAQFGTDLHRIFEALKYRNPEEIYHLLTVSESEAVKYLYSIKELNFSELLVCGHSEWGFGLQLKSRFVQGQIDLWAETDSKIYVIDYKTGSSEYADKAISQLTFYTAALAQMNKISKNKPIYLGVIYALEKTIVAKEYANYAEFEKAMASEVKELLFS